MKKLNSLELLTGFLMGAFIGSMLEGVLLFVINLVCPIFVNVPMMLTRWNFFSFSLYR